MDEDNARTRDRMDVRHSVNEAKRDLASGKVVVHDDIIKYRRPFTGVVNSNGRTEIVPIDKVSVTVDRPKTSGDAGAGLRDFMGDWTKGCVPR